MIRYLRSNDLYFFFFNDTATTEIYTLSLHDALPIFGVPDPAHAYDGGPAHHRRRDGPVPREPQPGARRGPRDEHRRGRGVPGRGEDDQASRGAGGALRNRRPLSSRSGRPPARWADVAGCLT